MDEFQTYDCPRDLEQFGVLPLTGEACGVGMRMLCDLTQEGVDLIREFMRVEPTADAWNSKGIKSIMLPRALFQDLWIFAMIRAGVDNVFMGGHVHHDQWTETVYETINATVKHPVATWKSKACAVKEGKYMDSLRKQEGVCFYIERRFVMSKAPGTGLDNTHAATGRTV